MRRRGGGDGKETETLSRALERGTDTGLVIKFLFLCHLLHPAVAWGVAH